MIFSHRKILDEIAELNQRIDSIDQKFDTVRENTNQILKALKDLQHELLELMDNKVQNFEGDDE